MTESSSVVRLTMIRVRELPLLADIGINADEIGRRQPLIISIDATLGGGVGESIDQTLDYRKLAQAAEELAQVRIPLIETFALRLGELCLKMPHVVKVLVRIDKPFALTRGIAGVELELDSNRPAQEAARGGA